MKSIYLFFFLSLFAQILSAQKEVTLDSKLERVTVFQKGAQLTRTAEATLPTGETILVLKKLSPYLQPNSVQVKSDGDLVLVSVNSRKNFLEIEEQSEQIETLQQESENLQDSLAETNALLEVIAQEEDFLNQNKTVGGTQNGYEFTNLREVSTYYGERLRTLKLERLELNRKVKTFTTEKEKIDQQIKELMGERNQSTSEIVLKVRTEQALQTELEISYLALNASWFPTYDLKAKDVASPVALTYKANVQQNTGEDWNDVLLTFSNGNPSQSGKMPELNPYYLSFNRPQPRAYQNFGSYDENTVSGIIRDINGEPLIGANITVKGTSIGTVTDFDGVYSLTLPNPDAVLVISYAGFQPQEIPVQSRRTDVVLEEGLALDEVVVTGLAGRASGISVEKAKPAQPKPAPTIVRENQTTVEFTLDIPYTLKSDGKSTTIDMAVFDIPATYEYQAVPKLEEKAYLTAKITDWEQYNLLEGEVNLYFENTYIGKSVLDVRYISDTLEVSLGSDKNVQVRREQITDFEKRNFIGNKRIETAGHRIWVRNNKAQDIRLVIYDQIPLSNNKDIEVENEELTAGNLNEETGRITWTGNLTAGQEFSFRNRYSVKYPKDEFIHLE